MKYTVAGPVTERGIQFEYCYPGDIDSSFTSLIVATIDAMNLKKKVVSFERLCEEVGTWAPHNGTDAKPRTMIDYGPRNMRIALARFGYQVIK